MDRGYANKATGGLKGWRALVSILVSGTLAAFVVFSIVFLIFRGVFSSLSDSDSNGHATPTWQPLDTLSKNELDLCGKTMKKLNIVTERLDSSGDYKDKEVGTGEQKRRIIRDDCQWKISSSSGEMIMHLDYQVDIPISNKSSGLKRAEDRYKKEKNEAETLFGSLEEKGHQESLGENIEYFYGYLENDDKKPAYVLVGRDRIGVFKMRLQQNEILIDGSRFEKSDFLVVARNVVPHIRTNLQRWIPS
ncbi:hypothetical protein [Salinactinospora qingdaonensis]|uniref:hypothetical protein n=1 Tax=Salinactinospora qingdaonensis TaxID=702744 RepID=UPI0031E9BA57